MTSHPRLKRVSIIRLGKILNMLYRPSELAEDICVSVDTIYRSYIPAGMPYSKDQSGDIWINGLQFVAWAKETITKSKEKRFPLPDDHAWCMHCNKPVKMINPIITFKNRYVEILQSKCPICGKKINRGRKAGGQS